MGLKSIDFFFFGLVAIHMFQCKPVLIINVLFMLVSVRTADHTQMVKPLLDPSPTVRPIKLKLLLKYLLSQS